MGPGQRVDFVLDRPSSCSRRSASCQRQFAILRVHRLSGALTMIPASAYAAHTADGPLSPFTFARRVARPDRRPHRDPLLRRVPFGPAHRAQRVAGHRVSRRPRARDRRPRGVGRQRRHEVQGRGHGGRGLPGGLVPRLPELRRQPGAVLREGDGADLQQPRRAHPRRDDLRRLLERRSWSTSTSCCECRRRSIRRPRRRCCAPASRPIRRCGTGTPVPARRSASSASAGSGTWA